MLPEYVPFNNWVNKRTGSLDIELIFKNAMFDAWQAGREHERNLTTNAGDLAEGCANNCEFWSDGCLIAECPYGHTPSA